MSIDRFSWETTAEDAIDGIDLTGIRAIVTGGTSGIGAETVRVLALAGAEVTLTGRNVEAGERLVRGIAARDAAASVRVVGMDLADLDSVRAFARSWTGPLHLLINNAGVMALPARMLSPAGHELQFATNHLGHFTLTVELHDALAAGARESVVTDGTLGHARVVSLSSRGHLRSDVDFDDIDFVHRPYDPMIAYGQSKTANVLFAVEAASRWADDGITANAVHPGAILETNLSRHIPPEVLQAIGASNQQAYKTIGQGAATSVVVATAPALSDIAGAYFEDCQRSEVIGPDDQDIASHPRGVAWYALDRDRAARLWELSEHLVA
jgi:NAD(P)-dependent dehydrogenase (short-subunit alcohol dehydrogenase family)